MSKTKKTQETPQQNNTSTDTVKPNISKWEIEHPRRKKGSILGICIGRSTGKVLYIARY